MVIIINENIMRPEKKLKICRWLRWIADHAIIIGFLFIRVHSADSKHTYNICEWFYFFFSLLSLPSLSVWIPLPINYIYLSICIFTYILWCSYYVFPMCEFHVDFFLFSIHVQNYGTHTHTKTQILYYGLTYVPISVWCIRTSNSR